jgi:hypothetical protein
MLRRRFQKAEGSSPSTSLKRFVSSAQKPHSSSLCKWLTPSSQFLRTSLPRITCLWAAFAILRGGEGNPRCYSLTKKGRKRDQDVLNWLVESIRRYPWTTLAALKGDPQILRKLEETEKLLRDLKKALSRRKQWSAAKFCLGNCPGGCGSREQILTDGLISLMDLLPG